MSAPLGYLEMTPFEDVIRSHIKELQIGRSELSTFDLRAGNLQFSFFYKALNWLEICLAVTPFYHWEL
jgi:hypothetical protein